MRWVFTRPANTSRFRGIRGYDPTRQSRRGRGSLKILFDETLSIYWATRCGKAGIKSERAGEFIKIDNHRSWGWRIVNYLNIELFEPQTSAASICELYALKAFVKSVKHVS